MFLLLATFHIGGDLLSTWLPTTGEEVVIEKVVRLSPGRHMVHIGTDAQRLRADGDSRVLYFRVNDFSVMPAHGAAHS
jgi:hypothetical protein